MDKTKEEIRRTQLLVWSNPTERTPGRRKSEITDLEKENLRKRSPHYGKVLKHKKGKTRPSPESPLLSIYLVLLHNLQGKTYSEVMSAFEDLEDRKRVAYLVRIGRFIWKDPE